MNSIAVELPCENTVFTRFRSTPAARRRAVLAACEDEILNLWEEFAMSRKDKSSKALNALLVLNQAIDGALRAKSVAR